MKTILKKLDIALDILVPLSLIIVTIPIVFPILQRLTDFWLDIPFLSKFFDKSQRAFFLIPIVLYSVSLTIKHIRAFSHQERRSLAWLICIIGSGGRDYNILPDIFYN